MPIISKRCATSDHMPQPASAITTATTPLMSDERNTIFESSLNLNSRVNITVCTTQSELIGKTRNNTGAISEIIGWS